MGSIGANLGRCICVYTFVYVCIYIYVYICICRFGVEIENQMEKNMENWMTLGE